MRSPNLGEAPLQVVGGSAADPIAANQTIGTGIPLSMRFGMENSSLVSG